MNPLQKLWTDHKQAVWLDFIQRSLVQQGGLARLVEEDGVRGVTSNPSIFEKAIAGTAEYDAAIDALLSANPDIPTVDIYEALAIEDIQMAADVMRPVYDQSDGSDGFVSLEVSPTLARETEGTIDEARRLWKTVDRPNLMIKVPATAEGIPAMETLFADGLNVNATLMFSLADYEAVAQAYLRGLARASEPQRVASVASFFVSRIDSVVDSQLEALGSTEAHTLYGTAAIANARMAYARYLEIFHGPAFEDLRKRGARVQRPLWASTSTKNPAYRDVLYIEELIGPETVNTIPTSTLEAFRDHGQLRPSLEEKLAEAPQVIAAIRELGIDFDQITEDLQIKGVQAFAEAFAGLLEVLETKRKDRLQRR